MQFIKTFLQTVPFSDSEVLGTLLGLAIGVLVFLFVMAIAFYIYGSLAFMSIAKKAGRKDLAGIAWIPIIGKAILMNRISKMHWWPLLLLFSYPLVFFPSFSVLMIIWPAMIIFAVYSIIWFWKTFEAVGKPGWWAILILIPFVGIILYLVFIGIAAWGETSERKIR